MAKCRPLTYGQLLYVVLLRVQSKNNITVLVKNVCVNGKPGHQVGMYTKDIVYKGVLENATIV